jgi:uncharacterized protein (TIGR02145 family)
MKRVKINSKVAMLAAMFAITFTTSAFAQEKGTFTDPRDKAKYKTVEIGKQVWMAENLNYNAKGSRCYGNKDANCTKYGRLYYWDMAMALKLSCQVEKCSEQVNEKHQGICPTGWHIPNNKEWKELHHYANGTLTEYKNLSDIFDGNETAGKHLKAKSGWNKSGNGTDKFGFSALPGGDFDVDLTTKKDRFNSIGEIGYWWSAIESSDNKAYTTSMNYGSEKTAMGADGYKYHAKSVRCVKD